MLAGLPSPALHIRHSYLTASAAFSIVPFTASSTALVASVTFAPESLTAIAAFLATSEPVVFAASAAFFAASVAALIGLAGFLTAGALTAGALTDGALTAGALTA